MDRHFNLEPTPTKKVKKQTNGEEQNQKPIIFHGQSVYVFVDRCSRELNKFLKDVCDPVSKPQKIHEYKLTDQSLVRAQALGYKQQLIITKFEENMRNKGRIPTRAKQQIMRHVTQGECELFLQWIANVCHYRFVINKNLYELKRNQLQMYLQERKEITQDNKNCFSFKVKKYCHIDLQQKLWKTNMPVRADRKVTSFFPDDLSKLRGGKHIAYCHNIQINLKSFTQLREYQSEALNAVVKIEGDNISAKSGYIVLPCGAGKTLLGISILCKVKKETLIVCSSDSGTQQWKRQIQKWTQSFPRQQIIIITSQNKFQFKNSMHGQIFISTYSFLKTHINANTKEGIKTMDEWIVKKPWGLVIFDQCQTLPAKQNREIVQTLLAQVKIGLTATPLRQDNQFKNLNFMVGPQLYVGDWKNFVEQGYLANPKCIQIRTELTPKFKIKYKQFEERQEEKKKKREMCFIINPNKIKALIYLLYHHEQLNDHILVFSDNTAILYYLAAKLRRPVLTGEEKNDERMFIFDKFRNGQIKTLFLSRIGDQAIDLPNANVGIELNIQYGSRRQMLQRLGRIMRQKQASSSLSYNAIFYTITTYGTSEWSYFFERYRCLIDQGFHYDLRLFEFRPQQIEDIQNILELDPKDKKQIDAHYNKIIEDEEKYWNELLQSKQSKSDDYMQ